MKRILYFLVFLLLLVACRQESRSEWQADELVKIDGRPVKTAEAAVYGIQVKKEFEQIGGEDIWEFEAFSGGKSAYEVAKTKVLENLIRVKILATKAEERKIKLTEEEKAALNDQAEKFFADKRELELADVPISPEDVKAVLMDFELGQKLKREMLRSFQPTAELVEAKLAEDEVYQALAKEDPREKYEHYILWTAEIKVGEDTKKQIEDIRVQLNENGGLTDALSQSMVYQEEKYTKSELERIFGEGFADGLKKKPEQLLLTEDGAAYLYIRLEAIQLKGSDALHLDLKTLDQKKQKLREQAEEAVRDESFDIIYSEWKKETDIQINQEIWQEFVVFSLPKEKN